MIGLGTDIVAVDRIAALIARHDTRFTTRVFQPAEIALADRRGQRRAATLAGRWAAKEAFLKALGRSTAGIAARDIEVVSDEMGCPSLRLHGTAQAALAATGGNRTYLSISHEHRYAVAVVVIT
jgi:holo-[acyl-carrier protein] synthase